MIHLEYLRKSRDRRERDDPDVLSRHRAILLELQRSDGVELSPEHRFEEVGSSERITGRPAFQRLLALLKGLPDCPKDKVQVRLYCMDADRLSRALATERGEIQELFARKGVVIRTPVGETDVRDTDQRLLHEVKGALASWEIGKYKDRVARTRNLQLYEGKVRNAKVPYGYLWDRNTGAPAPHPERFPILQACCREAFTRSVYELAKEHGLERRKLTTALRSPMICGYPAKTTRPVNDKRRTVSLPRSEWLFVPGRWPENEGTYLKAMDLPDWLLLQETLDQRSKGKGENAHRDHWCRDVVQFVADPGPAHLSAYHSRTAGFLTYARGQEWVKRAAVHAAVEAAIRPALDNPQTLAILEQLSVSKKRIKLPEEMALKQEMEQLQTQLDNCVDEMTKPNTTPERLISLGRVEVRVQQRMGEVKAMLRQCRAEVPELSPAEAKAASDLCGHFGTVWPGWEHELKRVLVNGLVERVAVTIIRPRKGGWATREVAVSLKEWARSVAAGVDEL
jgi:DNA invertase Pin-like site-specific DNA recombinase